MQAERTFKTLTAGGLDYRHTALRLWRKAKRLGTWDPDALERTLARAGFGLLLVEGDRAYEVQAPAQQRVPETRLEEVLAGL